MTSVAGRTGAVTLTAADISGLAVSATTDTTIAGNISSGTLSNARLSGVALTASNLSDLANAGTARTNLGLAALAVLGVGSGLTSGGGNLSANVTSVAGRTGAVTLAAGDVSGLAASATTDTTNAGNISSGTLANARLSGVALIANNLSDLASAGAARTNLGLGAAATLGLGANLTSSGGNITTTATISTDAYKVSSSNINAQTGTSYTLQASDNGKVVTLNNASAITLTVPSGLGAGFTCALIQLGAGQVTVTPSSTTVNSYSSLTKTAGQYAGASLYAYAADIFALTGALA